MTAEEFRKKEGWHYANFFIEEELDYSALDEFAEAYASHVLQEYKEELAEWVKGQIQVERKLFVEIGRHQAFEFVLTKLKEE